MTEAYKAIEVNCETGEEIVRDLTSEEIEELKKLDMEAKAEQALREAEAQAKAAAKQSAQDKLKSLGLSDLEIAAITGA